LLYHTLFMNNPANKKLAIYIIFILIGFISCNDHLLKQAAIRDFPEPLRSHLKDIVSRAVVGWDTSTKYIELHATDQELRDLSKCEHPVLRATALDVMTKRPSFDHFSIIMTNLDDSSVVATDAGEWGVRYYSVSDNMVQNARWRDTAARNRTKEEIITHHHYLKSAYWSLSRIHLKKEYYPIIKQMALQEDSHPEEVSSLSLGGIDFETRESALFALATYKKTEDIQEIKKALLHNAGRLSLSSFALMLNFRDTTYMEVYEKCLHSLYRGLLNDRISEVAVSFIRSLAAQKNLKSAELLQRMLKRKPFMPCTVDSSYIINELYAAVWENSCPEYASLRKEAEPFVRKQRENTFELPPVDPIHFVDTAKEPVRWWSN